MIEMFVFVEVNGCCYNWMSWFVVVVCVDGCVYEYLEEVVEVGVVLFLCMLLKLGIVFKGECVVLSFMNLNNLLIVIGVLLVIYGISGNYFYDCDIGVEVLMNDLKYLVVFIVFVIFVE